jgi:hypothetical protein
LLIVVQPLFLSLDFEAALARWHSTSLAAIPQTHTPSRMRNFTIPGTPCGMWRVPIKSVRWFLRLVWTFHIISPDLSELSTPRSENVKRIMAAAGRNSVERTTFCIWSITHVYAIVATRDHYWDWCEC